MTANPFRITAYNSIFEFKGYVGNPISVSINVRHNQQGTASIVLDADHRMVGALSAPGARVVFHHRPAGAWEFLMSGKVKSRRGEGPTLKSTVTFEIADDIRILSQILGWPVPGSAITSQSAAEYATYTGAAETVVKNAARANINRLGLPVTVATDQGRGDIVPGGVAFRFHPLADKLLPAAEAGGVGITVRQDGAGLVLDCYQPRVYPHTLSEKAGTITEWSWEDRDPTATRAITGGKGEGTARVFNRSVDANLENAHGDVFEVFKDATDVDTAAALQDRAKQTLAEGKPTYGFSVKLSETGMFRYGQGGVLVGDLVPFEIAGATRTDVLRECTLAFNRDSGPTQTPVIGDIDQSTDRKLAKVIGGILAGLRNPKR
ncbi:hypothetical protein AB0284_21620 [Pseudarthrobacter phenanthrenivorans]|uniref:Gp37-like protein n=1 Tax=Pseudarthrobacter phenanthrenivorans TaxID=361575 RepID=UPI00344CC206